MLRNLAPLALLGTLAAPVQAQATGDTSIQGTYAIQVLLEDQGKNIVAGCLVNGDASNPSTPFSSNWGSPKCDAPPQAGSEAHLWEVHNIGPSLHVIRSRVNGYCLIRGNHGHAERPQLHLWNLSADKRYCGFPDAHALMENGQALWDLSALSRVYSWTTGLPQFQGPIRIPKFAGSYLAFDMPAAGWLAEFSRFSDTGDQWSVAFITQLPVLPAR